MAVALLHVHIHRGLGVGQGGGLVGKGLVHYDLGSVILPSWGLRIQALESWRPLGNIAIVRLDLVPLAGVLILGASQAVDLRNVQTAGEGDGGPQWLVAGCQYLVAGSQ